MKDTTGGQLQRDLESIERFHKDKCPRCLNKDCNCTYKGEEKAATERIREIEEKKYKDVTGGDGYGATVNAICDYLDEISTPHTEKEEKVNCSAYHPVGVLCNFCGTTYVSPSDKTWEERLIELFNGNLALSDDAFQKVYEKVHILPALKSFIQKELTSATIKAREEVLRDILEMTKYGEDGIYIPTEEIELYAKEKGINLEELSK